jgi:iron complex outermembrane recepter protein
VIFRGHGRKGGGDMPKLSILKSALIGGASAIIATGAWAHDFNIPAGDLGSALNAFTTQAGIALVVSGDAVKGVHTRGAQGDLPAEVALSRILRDTGFKAQTDLGVIAIVRDHQKTSSAATPVTRLADAATPAHAAAGVETVVVTSSKIKGDIQTVPIAITALSQEQLTSRQIAGGPDLVKEVPNLTFSKTNFTGYNIQIRGIGTQAISVTTDPAVAVAFNDIPFIRNHFFEQEFYDLSQVEVLRGPQGTLYGRNATAGVVNVISAKPTDQFEVMLSADWGNYHNRRYEGMVNIPLVDDRLDLRVAGEWTKRDGYSFDTITNSPIDGRDLWSSRVTLGWKPSENFQAYLVWEHFGENDDRMRTAKQLCKTAPIPDSVGGQPVGPLGEYNSSGDFLSQGCEAVSLYSPDAFQVPNGFSLPYYSALSNAGVPVQINGFNPYASTTQSTNLRDIESSINPIYKAKNDTLELNADYRITPALTFTSQTGFNNDFLWSTEDYNRFNSAPGAFAYNSDDGNEVWALQHGVIQLDPAAGVNGVPADAAIFCDPQLGCSDRLVAQDLSEERAWQLSQEFRLASNFSGPLNFSFGGNYLHYETQENYFVFINTLSLYSAMSGGSWSQYPSNHYWMPGVSDNSDCLSGSLRYANSSLPHSVLGFIGCPYIDPNPLSSLNNQGHNYFLSQNPYVLNSYAGFGEVYYKVTNDLKLTGGLRWTDDQKHFLEIPSQLLVQGYGYPVTGSVDQQWNQWTGRAVADWTPKLDFTDQTLIYGSYSHGYKAGGANPPGAELLQFLNSNGTSTNPIHPLTFKPEFVDAFELGTKNTMLDGALTLNGDVFYYNYKGYQISRIVDRTAINDNFNAHVKGAELEAAWEATPGLKFTFAGGYEDATLAKGSKSVDLMDRTAGNPNWMVVKPFVTYASNCILPVYVVAAELESNSDSLFNFCGYAYGEHVDPVVKSTTPNPLPAGYPGFDPVSPDATNNGAGPAPNNGEGFDKNLSGNQLPNAPHFTTSLSGDYTMPVSEDWAATLHGDFYWQSQSFARVFNDRPYDKLRGYSTTNLALILTSASGWQVMGYLKNVFDVTAITGDFLNSDDSGLTTNVFLTDPRLYGVRITKNF